MDGTRFDNLTRALATSRRGALKMLLGTAAAGIAAVVAREATGVAADEADEARRNPYFRMGKPCDNGQRCGSKLTCNDEGICQPHECFIDGQTYQTGRNPNNWCQFCFPRAERWTWEAWQSRAPGTVCYDELNTAPPCLADHGICSDDGVCALDPEQDGTLCGPANTCCGGECCSSTQCCSLSSHCEECGPHCTIEGVPYPDGTVNPGTCQICNAGAEPYFWSTAADNTECGPNLDQVCCNGGCLPAGETCGTSCTIGGVDYLIGDFNTDDYCLWCDGRVSATSWSPVPNGRACDPAGLTMCCNGACCPQGQACIEGEGTVFCGSYY